MAESVEAFFNEVQGKIDPNKIQGMNAIYQFSISGDGGGEWFVKLADGKGEVGQGTAENPNITISAASDVWLDIVSGKMNGQTAFLTGKIKIQGDMSLAMKLQSVFL
jgi:putative sterol carrier protein